jgi:hypothetical protein
MNQRNHGRYGEPDPLHVHNLVRYTAGCRYRETLYRTLKRAIQQGRRRVETGGVPQGYVEDFDEPRTMLVDVFSVLQEQA